MKSYIEKKLKLNVFELIIFFFPLILLLRSFVLNGYLIIVSLLTIILIKKNKIEIHYLYKFFFIFLLYIFFSSFFLDRSWHSIISILSQIKFILFAIFIYNFVTKSFFKKVKYYWLILIIFVAIDCYIQLYFGKDIFGFEYDKNYFRLSGPFNDEYIVGFYIAIFSVLTIAIFKQKLYDSESNFKIFSYYFLLFFFNITVLITGERVSFLIIFFSSILIHIFIFEKKKILYFFLAILFIFLIFLKIDSFNKRYNEVIKIVKNYSVSSYGRIHISAIDLWKNNKIFGVGLKNYRIDCPKLKDPNPQNPFPYCSTHPHNYILQLLSETGLIGFIIYSYFLFNLLFLLVKNIFYDKYKNPDPIELAILIIFISFIWPIKTSGSIFTTFNGSIFWFIIGLCGYILKKKKINNEK